ncbi:MULTISPECIES: toxin-activating lysine-acyltransferase [unclassified Tolypothrix]|uniref:toxin-activating lysine-acyltransferase n=1 Tax=unclassified Tolypothrix TaxID=2649714 RepID=UPI0005EAA7FC|nr:MULTISPECIES: toxin-activating lysine-acyltransferase [unclassified Tolypothrix]BAY88888.1 RTX toxin acyltransferase family protein [Microchaete diplosiphon NIES-3275]EKF03204.1 RTX toxin acyltransferase family protein [Tolypothrix sp. PCC 7601]MBE9086518.1 toxin-activating lysine-acyltransferase [Tolypothrix sp. LEGE 11397]UYD29531.1 toxin-activating lysine-acyltransferase [Tolypothrix sp. PCC 7712]UYD34557.1 toxin-activating lysine-acyltransferase [Tolypothrix sp. PCC 7601]
MVLISESPTINSSFSESIKEGNVRNSFSTQQPLKLIGSITHLMISSPLHRKYKIASISERFVPSLIHNQFRYYEIDGNPIGFVNWAWLTDEVEEKFLKGKYVLQLDEWQGGNNLWFPEFIAPFGHARLIIKDLRNNIFPKGTPAKSLKINPDGTLKSIYRWTA